MYQIGCKFLYQMAESFVGNNIFLSAVCTISAGNIRSTVKTVRFFP
jgi:hypothetical protein